MARMNPPTPGHLFLIENLIRVGLEKKVERVYIILSKTNDNNENPISCQEKINVLGENNEIINAMIHKLKERMTQSLSDSNEKERIMSMQVIPICVPDVPRATPFTVISGLLYQREEMKNIELYVIIGDDRADLVDNIADMYFYKKDNVMAIDAKVLERTEMNTYKNLSASELATLDMRTVPINAFSASFVRKIVKNNLKDAFRVIYEPYLENDKIEILYNLIKEGLNLPTNKKKESPPKPSKYDYPLKKNNAMERQRKGKMREVESYGGFKKGKSKRLSKRKRREKKTRKSISIKRGGGKSRRNR
jgi:hypothetical protein